MESYLQKICNNPQRCDFIYLVGLNLVRLAVQIYLFQQGFLSVSADEFARGIRAAKWARHLRIDILADVQGTWLPFEKYVNGLALRLWPDEILVPRATIFIASCLLILVLYYLVNYLFASKTAAFTATLFISIQPWFVWLSGTPMLEMYYFAFFFAGLLFLLIWLKEQRRGFWLWAGVCFFLASGFHVQSWTFINLVNLLTLPYLYKYARQKKTPKLARLIGFYFLGNGLILAFSLIEFLHTGEIFAFLGNHTTYSKWYYAGYNVPILEKFLYYPRLVWHNANLALWAGLIIGLLFLARSEIRNWAIFPLKLTLAGLLLNSALNIFSGPPSAAPDRYALFHIIVFSLYVGYGFARLMFLRQVTWPHWGRYVAGFAAWLLLAYGVWWSVVRIPDFPKGMSPDTVAVGNAVEAMLEGSPGTFMVELHYWDFLGVELAAAHFDDLLYDRVRDIQNREVPSIFLQEAEPLCHALAAFEDLRFVLLRDEALKVRAAETAYLEFVQNEGHWTIYRMIPEQSPALAGCS